MEYKHMNQRKGVAGLEVLLSVIAMLFMIGLIVMVFVIAGAKLQTAVESTVDVESVGNSTQHTGVGTVYSMNYNTITNSSFIVLNSTGDQILTAGVDYGLNPTTGVLTLTSTGASYVNTTGALYFNVSYTYLPDSVAGNVINATYQSLDDVTDWFPTFIVLTAMVVLILLVVIIIKSIQGSGLTGNSGA